MGELIAWDWRLGIALKGSNCKNLASPYVSLLIKVKDQNQQINTYTFELSLSQFQVKQPKLKLTSQDFAKHFNEIGQLMESMA